MSAETHSFEEADNMNTEFKTTSPDDGLASLSAAAFMLSHGGMRVNEGAPIDRQSPRKPTLDESLEADFNRLFSKFD